MARGWATVVVVVLVGLANGVNTAVMAAVPQRDRVEQAIAKTNATAGRARTMEIDVIVQIGDRTAVARGEILTDPSGRARLELRGAGDLVERHLLQEGESRAARNGQLLAQPRSFLPPLFVLQASNPESLRKALLSFEVDPGPLGLVECGEEDCLLLGDPGLDIPRLPGPSLLGLEEYEREKVQAVEARRVEFEAARIWFWGGLDRIVLAGLVAQAQADRQTALIELDAQPNSTREGAAVDSEGPNSVADWNGSAKSRVAFPAEGSQENPRTVAEGIALDAGLEEAAPSLQSPFWLPSEAPRVASLWVTREGYDIRGFETAEGTRVELGPLASFGGVLLPSWILIKEAGQEPIRLEIEAARRVKVEPADFSEQWLLAPTSASPSAPEPPSALTPAGDRPIPSPDA